LRRLSLTAAAVLAVAAVAVPAFAATRTVKIGDSYFVRKGSPQTITVKHGTIVKWLWTGKLAHNVTVISGPVKFHSKTQSRGTFSRTLTRRGRYFIVCTIHRALGQKMYVKVT